MDEPRRRRPPSGPGQQDDTLDQVSIRTVQDIFLWRAYEAKPLLDQLTKWRERADERIGQLEQFQRDGVRWHDEVSIKTSQIGGIEQRTRDVERWQQDRNVTIGNLRKIFWMAGGSIVVSILTAVTFGVWGYFRTQLVPSQESLAGVRYELKIQMEQQAEKYDQQIRQLETENKKLRELVKQRPSGPSSDVGRDEWVR